MRYLLLLGFFLLFVPSAQARPVSYPGGWTFMSMNDGDDSIVHLLYTPSPHYAVGYAGHYHRDDEYGVQAVQLNNLLARWNNPDSQGNLYLMSGAGVAFSDAGDFAGERAGAVYSGLAADWEDRRYFVSYENQYLSGGRIVQKYTQTARVGITPYIGEYGDLHTWLMLQVDHDSTGWDRFNITPLVRFFKGAHLVEVGARLDGGALLNWTIRF